MLSLMLKSGEYLTIGDNIVVQVTEKSGGGFQVSVQAPREIPIVRGELLDRVGQRPVGFSPKKPKVSSGRVGRMKS